MIEQDQDEPLINLLILDQLREGKKYPYMIIKGVMKKFKMQYKPSTGAIYPALSKLVDKGHITKDKRNFYITDSGLELLQSREESFNERVSILMDNKIFLKNFHEALKRISRAIYSSDREFIEQNKEEILSDLNKIASKVENTKWK